jgi:uncharacterized DUF497 family protein
LEFEWDEEKDRENIRKHDVRFETAKLVFDDPLAMNARDESNEWDEERWATIGTAGRGSVFFVAYTWRDEQTIRMISARTATKRERRIYEEAD